MRDNRVEEMPYADYMWSNLRDLDLSNNRIVRLPSALGKLNLDNLICSGNPLSQVRMFFPKEVGYPLNRLLKYRECLGLVFS